MTEWEIIGIEPTQDIKVLKRAYATALKKCKPDEDPVAFQTLHQAYKKLLQHLQRDKVASGFSSSAMPAETDEQGSADQETESADAVAVSVKIEVDSSDFQREAKAAFQIDLPEIEDILPYQPEETFDVQELVDDLYTALCQTDSEQGVTLVQQVLQKSFGLSLYDKRIFSIKLFAALLKLEQEIPESFTALFESEVMYILLRNLCWLEERGLIEEEFDLKDSDRLLSRMQEYLKRYQQGELGYQLDKKIELKKTQVLEFQNRKTSVIKRMFVYIFDLGLLSLGVMLLSRFLSLHNSEIGFFTGKGIFVFIVLFPLAYFVYFIFFESKYGMTPMKRIWKIKVVDSEGRQPGFWHIVWRTISLFVSLLTIKLLIIHLYFWWFRKGTFHDKLSGTYVFKVV
jgi:uncharacterized RDD family membrane protein YckC